MMFDSQLGLADSERLLDAIEGFLTFVQDEKDSRDDYPYTITPYSVGEVEARMQVKIDPRSDARLRGMVERQVAR